MKNEIVIVIGRKGCGKTTMSRSLVSDKKRVVIFDPHGEYDNCYQTKHFSEFANFVRHYRYGPVFRVSYFPAEKDIKYIFSVLCDLVYEIGHLTFVVEELGTFVTPTSYSANFGRLVRFSRHNEVNLIGVTQRAVDIPKPLRGQADTIYTFQQIEPGDIKYLKEFLDSSLVDKIRHLNNHAYLKYSADGRISFGKTKIAK